MPHPASLQLIAGLDDLATIRQFVEQHATELGASPDTTDDLLLAVTEVVTNSIEHGYQGRPGPIEIEIDTEGDSIVVRLRDQAPAFDPRLAPMPDTSLPLQDRPLGGLGVFLVRNITDELSYRFLPQGGNEISLVKRHAIAPAV